MLTFPARMTAAIAGAYALVVLAAWSAQRYLVYSPKPTHVAPASVGLTDVAERRLPVGDGISVVAWYGRAGPGRPTILYFHGNAGNLAGRAERIRYFRDRGIGIYMMSYRGYSGSGGVPSETDNISDARLAYRDLLSTGVEAGTVFLYGESMGTGVASRLAVDTPAAGLILDAPFTSITDIGARQYPWLPVRMLLQHRYDTISIIGKVRMPLLVVHGEADPVVPVEMGRAVFIAAVSAKPKRLVTIPGAGHSNHASFGSLPIIAGFIDVTAGRLSP